MLSPRIESLHIENFRVLQQFSMDKLLPMNVLLGPNGSGKSTVFDALSFISECCSTGLRKAWEQRGRFQQMRSRGGKGPIVLRIKYRENPDQPLLHYCLAIEENSAGPYVAEEYLEWASLEKDLRFLHFQNGAGYVIPGEIPGAESRREEERLDSPETIAVNALGQLAKNPRISALRRFVAGWYFSRLSTEGTRRVAEPGEQEYLSCEGENLSNVIQYLKNRHPDSWNEIMKKLCSHVPRLEEIISEPMSDGRLLLQIKDFPFMQAIPAKFASDGTLKLLAYLTILYNPKLRPLIGLEEPENYLHPRLLPGLAEECRKTSSDTQLFLTTHSPFFINCIRPQELWVLYRNERGYTQARRASDMQGISAFMETGAKLGHLWMEGYFDAGDPLVAAGGMKNQANRYKNRE